MTLQVRSHMVTKHCAGDSRSGGGSRCGFHLSFVGASHSLQGNWSFPMAAGQLTPSAACHLSPQRREGDVGFGARIQEPKSRNHNSWDETPGSLPTKAAGQQGARTRAGSAPPQGGRPLRCGPPPPLQPNQQPLPALLSANSHTPRRIALGGVWEGD